MGVVMGWVVDWDKRLAALIEDYRHRPFAWGSCDCLIFANDAHRAMTGEGFADDWLGGYDSALGAARLVRGHDPIAALDDRLKRGTGFPPRGSIVATKARSVLGYALGVNIGVNAFVGATGLTFRAVEPDQLWWMPC